MTIDRDAFDPALDALVRAHSNETPPTEVDAAILSAAHRAVASAPRNADDGAGSRPWRRWMPLAAAATIAAIAFGVLQVAPTNTRVAPPDVGDTPRVARFAPDGRSARDATAAADSESSSKKTAQPAAPLASAPLASAPVPNAPAANARRETATPAAAPASGAQRERASAPQPFPLQKKQATNALAPSAPAPAAEAVARAAEPAAPQPETAGALTRSLRADQAAGVGPRSVAEWIARLRALRDEGKPAEAAQALAQFRLTYTDADARLPEDLRAWAGTITR